MRSILSIFKGKNTTDDELNDDYSNVIGPKILTREAEKVLKFEAEVFTRTLGPYGMNTIMEDRNLQHRVSKDGYTVYLSMVIYNKIARVLARLFQKISGSLNEVVGDGTTSSVVVGYELYRKLKRLSRKYKIPPKVLSSMVEYVSKQIVDAVKKDSIDLQKYVEKYRDILNDTNLSEKERYDILSKTDYYKIVKNLASISLNNSYADGKLVADMLTSLKDPANGYINPDISRTSSTYYEKNRGFEIFRGFLLPEMINQGDERTCELANPYILMVKGDLMNSDVPAIGKVLDYVIGLRNSPLVIIANSFSKTMTETFRNSLINFAEKNHACMPFLAVEIDTESSIGYQTFLDIEANVGAQHIEVGNGRAFPLEKEAIAYQKYLGSAQRVVCRQNWTRIIDGNQSPSKVQTRIAEIDKSLEQLKSEPHIDHFSEIFKLNKRKACLMNDMVTLYVGGNTNEEKESRKDLFDDANRGTRSAMKNGICRGGNLEVAHICKEFLDGNFIEISKIAEDALNELGYTDLLDLKSTENLIRDIFLETKNAYTRVFARILNNKFRNKRKSLKIAEECVAEDKVYNLVTCKFEDWIDEEINDQPIETRFVINSCETDTQILNAAVSIINLIIASNQFIRVPKISQMQRNM